MPKDQCNYKCPECPHYNWHKPTSEKKKCKCPIDDGFCVYVCDLGICMKEEDCLFELYGEDDI